ncbi:MarR family winged helix-turn-helix transcriptional regulator [Amycolatopsis sp. SID8362]|uniref:MarR family winged helix-turn-helix transcriptional regulator n=1 Tax=Amycolatopsis sp. SID8362 TaxID=2690346 RepID=UPI0013717E0B|nr:MarR family winged helix-turn-helix transcriptional regulator [Amycolatopsis sp. SID8362]NBH06334.1 MarR family transcriptional regulator [Amycolatopsis sp. SID8362]NED43032.1 MarR family transcriptional regulator [Amycolatopsis sp. SID8362]
MKPFGWWLRHLHELLESSMARVLEAESLTRRHWQVLNTIALGARTPEEVDAAMAPFVTSEGSMAPKLADLRARGWVAEDGALTTDGLAAHARVEARIQEFRAKSMAGIGDDDYRTTIRTLERCAANLA